MMLSSSTTSHARLSFAVIRDEWFAVQTDRIPHRKCFSVVPSIEIKDQGVSLLTAYNTSFNNWIGRLADD